MSKKFSKSFDFRTQKIVFGLIFVKGYIIPSKETLLRIKGKTDLSVKVVFFINLHN